MAAIGYWGPHHKIHYDRRMEGHRPATTKLTEAEVRCIRKTYAQRDLYPHLNITQTALAKHFNTTAKNVSNIINRRIWKDVD